MDKTIKKILILVVGVPAFIGLIFIPLTVITMQFGLSNPNQGLLSKLLITFSACCVYFSYGFIFAHLMKQKRIIKSLRSKHETK